MTVFVLIIVVIGLVCLIIQRVGLPMRALPPPNGHLIGAVNDLADDPSRRDLFSSEAQRVVPFQMIYPAKARGTDATYMPDAGPQIDRKSVV